MDMVENTVSITTQSPDPHQGSSLKDWLFARLSIFFLFIKVKKCGFGGCVAHSTLLRARGVTKSGTSPKPLIG